MDEFWNNLYLKSFRGEGHLICDYFPEGIQCRFWLVQLINGYLPIRIYDLKPSESEDLSRLLRKKIYYSLIGKLNNGSKLEAESIHLHWHIIPFSENERFEGELLYPGNVEITSPDYVEQFYPIVVHEVTNFSLRRLCKCYSVKKRR